MTCTRGDETEDGLCPSIFSPLLISSTNGSSTFVHDINTGVVVGHLGNHVLSGVGIEPSRSWSVRRFDRPRLFAATFSTQISAQEIASCSLGGVVRIWKIGSGKEGRVDCRLDRFYCPSDTAKQFYGIHYLRKYRLLAVGGSRNGIFLINPFSDDRMNGVLLEPHPNSSYGQTSFESNLFCSSTSAGGLQAFDIETSKQLWRDTESKSTYCGVHVDAETQLLYTASSGSPVEISAYDVRTLTRIDTTCAACNPGSRHCYDFCLKDGMLVLPFNQSPTGEIRVYDLRDLTNPVTHIESDHKSNWRAACDFPGKPFFAIGSMGSCTAATYTLRGKLCWKSDPARERTGHTCPVRGVCSFDPFEGDGINSDEFVLERMEFFSLSLWSPEGGFPFVILRSSQGDEAGFELKALIAFLR